MIPSTINFFSTPTLPLSPALSEDGKNLTCNSINDLECCYCGGSSLETIEGSYASCLDCGSEFLVINNYLANCLYSLTPHWLPDEHQTSDFVAKQTNGLYSPVSLDGTEYSVASPPPYSGNELEILMKEFDIDQYATFLPSQPTPYSPSYTENCTSNIPCTSKSSGMFDDEHGEYILDQYASFLPFSDDDIELYSPNSFGEDDDYEKPCDSHEYTSIPNLRTIHHQDHVFNLSTPVALESFC